MIPLPASLTIARATKSEAHLQAKARAWLESHDRTPGWHASDILDPLQAYWRAVDPKPISDRLVPVFLIGKVLHSFVIAVVDDIRPNLAVSDEGSRVSEELGISYSPDIVKRGIVRELKTSRSFFEPKTLRDLNIYIEQVLIYMAAENKTVAQVWVLYFNLKNEEGKTAPQFRIYTTEVSQAGLDAVKMHIKATVASLDHAKQTNDKSALPLCRTWKCGEKNCEWWGKCQPPGRYGVPKKKWDAVKDKSE